MKYETWDDRRRNLTVYVIPRIGGVRLQELNAAHLNRLYAELLTSRRIQREGGLSISSVRRIHAMLSKALRDAIRWGRLPHSPAELADPPSMRVCRRLGGAACARGPATNCTASSRPPSGVRSIRRGRVQHRVRRSELLGQPLPDLNLLAATATVRHTVTPGENGYQHTDEQKRRIGLLVRRGR